MVEEIFWKMSISDLYMGIGLKRNISHFANMVKVAVSDNVITREEMELLEKIAKKFNIDKDKFKEILKNPDKIPTIAYLDCEERIERLYDLLKMISADHKTAKSEVSTLRKIVTGLAFPIHNIDTIVNCAIEIDMDKTNLDSFKKKILKANKF